MRQVHVYLGLLILSALLNVGLCGAVPVAWLLGRQSAAPAQTKADPVPAPFVPKAPASGPPVAVTVKELTGPKRETFIGKAVIVTGTPIQVWDDGKTAFHEAGQQFKVWAYPQAGQTFREGQACKLRGNVTGITGFVIELRECRAVD